MPPLPPPRVIVRIFISHVVWKLIKDDGIACFVLVCRLAGKAAVITSGASGIGAGTARLFVKHGAKVVVADVQDELGRSVCHEIGPEGTIFYVHCDVTCDSDININVLKRSR